MLNDCNYDKALLIGKISKIILFLKKHAEEDAIKENHVLCNKLYSELEKDLEKYVEKLRLAVEGLSKEGKFN